MSRNKQEGVFAGKRSGCSVRAGTYALAVFKVPSGAMAESITGRRYGHEIVRRVKASYGGKSPAVVQIE